MQRTTSPSHCSILIDLMSTATEQTILLYGTSRICSNTQFCPHASVVGKGYIDASTVDIATAESIAHEVHRTGAQFLEAPVSGSKGPAEQGQLIFLAAGAADCMPDSHPYPLRDSGSLQALSVYCNVSIHLSTMGSHVTPTPQLHS